MCCTGVEQLGKLRFHNLPNSGKTQHSGKVPSPVQASICIRYAGVCKLKTPCCVCVQIIGKLVLISHNDSISWQRWPLLLALRTPTVPAQVDCWKTLSQQPKLLGDRREAPVGGFGGLLGLASPVEAIPLSVAGAD